MKRLPGLILMATGLSVLMLILATRVRASVPALPMSDIRIVSTTLPAGMGNSNERLVGFRIVSASKGEALNRMVFNLDRCTDLADISLVKVYCNDSAQRLDLKRARLFGSVVPHTGEITMRGQAALAEGNNYFWITADISRNAVEGHHIGATVISFTKNDGVAVPVNQTGQNRVILLTSTLLYSAGDGGSKSYRIPAIVTATDGSLVTATDKRWNSPMDLPADIDVVVRRSADRGFTWSDAQTIAGLGTTIGFGDPSLIVDQVTGDIICLFASDKGWSSSTAAVPIRIYQSMSMDQGRHWSVPIEITPQIYGAACSNPITREWQGAFVTSGAAAQLRSGRLMAVLAARETKGMDISNFVIYSDDHAATWKVSTNKAFTKGDEAKVTQLANGDVLMSIRQSGHRWFAVSHDEGITWETPFIQNDMLDPFCNGDMISYPASAATKNKHLLLHSIPYAPSRKNVSILLSYDQGVTWPVKKTIYDGPSAYSALTILDDGSVGIYFEVGEYEIYQMYFMRCSLNFICQ